MNFTRVFRERKRDVSVRILVFLSIEKIVDVALENSMVNKISFVLVTLGIWCFY